MKKIITISREFGSGGHDIGMEVAKRLDIPFYDHEIVDKAVAESGFTKEFVEEHGEYSSLSSVLLGTSAPFDSYYYAEDPQDKIFKIQRRIITKFAQEGPCVFVGRCADQILKDDNQLLRVYIYASDMKDRIKRIKKNKNLSQREALERIAYTDRQRRGYYNFYTGCEWGKMENYDICLNTSVISEEECVELLMNLAE